MQPGAGVRPVPVGGRRRDFQHLGDLIEGEAGAELEFDEFRFSGVVQPIDGHRILDEFGIDEEADVDLAVAAGTDDGVSPSSAILSVRATSSALLPQRSRSRQRGRYT